MRHAVVQEIAKLVWAHGEELCIVRDVAPGGLRAEIYRSMPIGADVRCELRTGGTLSGNVAWVRDGHVGIGFAERVPMSSILTQCSLDPRVGTIRQPRVQADMPGSLRIDFRDTPVRIRNVSQGGLLVAGEEPVRPGGRCQIEAKGLEMRAATVAWWRDQEGGLMLAKPLSFEEFAAWRMEA
ncbi:hypothetical protein [uncultured Sphingomonas sp.]|uniref:hypothetical protein n=1 Tax=uncultured Sphingomonas sp. TaxID=158754 RepID=UPI0025E6A6B9|nr:hypothetical protein [uncultured Sphingomonas sp.]